MTQSDVELVLLSHQLESTGSCSTPGKKAEAGTVSSRTASQDWEQQNLYLLFYTKLIDCQLALWHGRKNWLRGKNWLKTDKNYRSREKFHGLPQVGTTSSSWDWLLQTSLGFWTVVRSWFSLPSPRTLHFPAWHSSQELQCGKFVVPAMSRRCQ